MRIRYVGALGHQSGYATAAMDYLAALKRLGVELEIVLRPDADLNRVPERFKHLIPDCQLTGKFDVTLLHTGPGSAASMMPSLESRKRTVLMTTWETSKLPLQLANDLNTFACVIVPCCWNVAILNAAGVEHVYRVPHCYDPVWWTPKKLFAEPNAEPNKIRKIHSIKDLIEDQGYTWQPLSALFQPRLFTFYSILRWVERKNPLGLLTAYWLAFRGNRDVLLRLVTPAWDKQAVIEQIAQLGIPRDELPAIEIHENLTDDAMKSLHYTSDCYVTFSRGEAWGLGAFEATITNRRVIAPCYGGSMDFLAVQDGVDLIAVHETPAVTKPSSYVATQDGAVGMELNVPPGMDGRQLWAEPDLLGGVKAMQSSFAHRYIHSPVLNRDLSDFTYSAVGPQLKAILEAV